MDSGQVMTPLMSGFEMQVMMMMMLFILVMGMIMMMLATMTKIYNFHHDHHFKVLHLERLCNRTVRPCRAQEDEFPGETLPSSSSSSFTFATIHRRLLLLQFLQLHSLLLQDPHHHSLLFQWQIKWWIGLLDLIRLFWDCWNSTQSNWKDAQTIKDPPPTSSQTAPPCSFQI